MKKKKSLKKSINSEKLRDCIENSGLKYSYIAKQLDIETQSLQRKLDMVYDFKLSEVKCLIKLLRLNWEKDLLLIREIFFV